MKVCARTQRVDVLFQRHAPNIPVPSSIKLDGSGVVNCAAPRLVIWFGD
jgi:hypothetical protein